MTLKNLTYLGRPSFSISKKDNLLCLQKYFKSYLKIGFRDQIWLPRIKMQSYYCVNNICRIVIAGLARFPHFPEVNGNLAMS